MRPLVNDHFLEASTGYPIARIFRALFQLQHYRP
jgi:hypothetical protein